jgi:hypothetical protein
LYYGVLYMEISGLSSLIPSYGIACPNAPTQDHIKK